MLSGLLLIYRQKTDFPYNKQKTLSSRLRSLKQFIVHDFIVLVSNIKPVIMKSVTKKRILYLCHLLLLEKKPLFVVSVAKRLSVLSSISISGSLVVPKKRLMQALCQPVSSGVRKGLPQHKQFILFPPLLKHCRFRPCRLRAKRRSGRGCQFSNYRLQFSKASLRE